MTDDAEKKSKCIQDVVENRLEAFFQEDDEDAGEDSECLQDVVDSRLEDLFPLDDQDTAEQPECLKDEVDSRLDDMFSEDDEDSELAEKVQIIEAHLDVSKEEPEIQKTDFPDKSTAEETKIEAATALTVQLEKRAAPLLTETKKPTGKNTIGMSLEGKRDEPETIVASDADKTPPQQASPWAIKAKPAALEKEQKKAGPEQSKNNRGLLKLILGGVFVIGCVLAFFFFSKSPEPTDQNKAVVAPKTHKIAYLPAKTPATETAPPVTPPISEQGAATTGQSETPSKEDKNTTQLKTVTVSPTDNTEPTQVATPVPSAPSRIKEWLLEWAAAWEKCAGKNGNMTAFMSFYSDDFSSNGFDKNRWHKDKLGKNRRKEWIRIKLDSIHIVGPLDNGYHEAKFTQVYQSSNYADTSKQTLILKNEASGWKIIGIKPQTQIRYPYAIHGGSFRTLPPAQKAVGGYRKRGLEAYWTRVELPEKSTWYRVFIGYYNSREAALKIIAAKALTDVIPVKARYANLIGTYSSEDDLQRQRRFISEKGCSPYVILDDNGDFNLYTGAYTSLENAEKHVAELNARGIPSHVVER